MNETRWGGVVEGGHVGEPVAALKVLQLISSTREDLEAYRAKPLVEGMVESGADTADNIEEVEV